MVKRRLSFLNLFILLILATLFLYVGSFSYQAPALEMDEATLLVYPEQISKGAIPYKDFETFYGPGNIYFLSLVYSNFGTDINVERTVGLLYRLSILLFLYGIARRENLIFAITIFVLSSVPLLSFGLSASAWLGALALALGFLYFLLKSIGGTEEDRGKFFLIISGLLAGLCLLYRPDFVLIVLGPTLILFKDKRKLLYFIPSFLLSLSSYLYFLFKIGFSPLYENLFLYPVILTRTGRTLPLYFALPLTRHLLLFHLASMVLAISLYLFCRSKKEILPYFLLPILLFSLLSTPQALQRFDIHHVVPLLPVSILLAMLSLYYLIRPYARSPLFLSVSLISGLFLSLSVSMICFIYSITFPYYVGTVTVGSRDYPLSKAASFKDVSDLTIRLSSLARPGEKLIVAPRDLSRTNYNDTFIYFLFPSLTPGTYFLEMNPRSANRKDTVLASEITKTNWLILNTRYDAWSEPNTSVIPGSTAPLLALARGDFEIVGNYGQYYLLHNKNPK